MALEPYLATEHIRRIRGIRRIRFQVV